MGSSLSPGIVEFSGYLFNRPNSNRDSDTNQGPCNSNPDESACDTNTNQGAGNADTDKSSGDTNTDEVTCNSDADKSACDTNSDGSSWRWCELLRRANLRCLHCVCDWCTSAVQRLSLSDAGANLYDKRLPTHCA